MSFNVIWINMGIQKWAGGPQWWAEGPPLSWFIVLGEMDWSFGRACVRTQPLFGHVQHGCVGQRICSLKIKKRTPHIKKISTRRNFFVLFIFSNSVRKSSKMAEMCPKKVKIPLFYPWWPKYDTYWWLCFLLHMLECTHVQSLDTRSGPHPSPRRG